MSSFVQKLPGLRGWKAAQGKSRKPFRAPKMSAVAAVLGALLLTLLVGAVVALGAMQLTVLLTGLLVFIPTVLFVNTRMLLPLVFVVVFLVQGLAEYFFNLRMATWLATGLCGLFFMRALLELSNRTRLGKAAGEQANTGRYVILAATLYLLFYFYSLSLGSLRPMQVISTLRFALPMFGVLFALYWFQWTDRSLARLWTLVVLVALAQLPIVVYQHFFMISSMGWDGVVGSFGKGMSATLVLFSTAGLLYVLARWTRGLTSLPVLLFVTVVTMAVILFGEVKAVLFWLPVGALWVLRRRIFSNVIALVMYSCLALVFTAGTYTAYKTMYWGAAHGRDDTLAEKIDSISAYAVDPNNVNFRTGEVSRGASLALWYRDPRSSPMERLVGYGPGASATNSTGQGIIAARYRPLAIAATSTASMLWDIGILGFIAYASILASGLVVGFRFVKPGTDPTQGAIVDTSVAVLALLASTLIYNRSLFDEPTAQLLSFFCLGCIVHYARYAPQAGAARTTAPSMHLAT